MRRALAETDALEKAYPELQTLTSIAGQLEYLISLDSGETSDRSRLSDIILGVQAAREVEALDMKLAEKLYRIDEEASRM